jgi:hypothetical protein
LNTQLTRRLNYPDDFHQTFYDTKGIDVVVEMLSFEEDASVAAALTALLYLSVSLEDLRTALVSKYQILMQLSTILETSTNNQVTDLSLQLLTNLSFSDVNEAPIAESGILLSVIDLLGSPYDNLQSRSAMLLANVSLNEAVRDKIRLFGWAEPAVKALTASNADVQLQILRFILNISLDDFCRKLLVDANAVGALESLLPSIPPHDERSELVQSVVNNLNAPIPQAVLDQFKAQMTPQVVEVEPLPPAATAPIQIPAAYTTPSGSQPVAIPVQQASPQPQSTPPLSKSPSGFIVAQPNRAVPPANSFPVGSAPAGASPAAAAPAVNPADAARRSTMIFDATNAPMYARREKVAKELLQTEMNYNATLGTMKRDFLLPLRQAALSNKAILNDDEIHKLFSVTEVLANIHATFCKKLEARILNWKWDTCVADIFIDMGEMLKAYKPYINNYDIALQFYATVATKKKSFQAFLKDASVKHPELGSAGLPHYLIQPIQRVPRYVMLLDQLVKFTPETHADHQNLGIALDKIKKITEYLNEAKRNAENVNKILDIENTVTGLNGSLLILGRKFVKEGTSIEERKGGSRTVLLYLFNDMLILCKVVKKLKRQGALGSIDKQYQVLRHVPLPDVTSVTVPEEDAKSAKLQISCKPDGDWNGNILLTFTTPEERDKWMNSISQARNSALAKVLRERRASIAPADRSASPAPSGQGKAPGSPSTGHIRSGSSTESPSSGPIRSSSSSQVASAHGRTNSSSSDIPAIQALNQAAGTSSGTPSTGVTPITFAASPAPNPNAAPTMPTLPNGQMDVNQMQQMQQQLQAQIQTMAHMLAMMQMQSAATGGPPTPDSQAQQAQLLQMMASGMAMMPVLGMQPGAPQQQPPNGQPQNQPPPGQ